MLVLFGSYPYCYIYIITQNILLLYIHKTYYISGYATGCKDLSCRPNIGSRLELLIKYCIIALKKKKKTIFHKILNCCDKCTIFTYDKYTQIGSVYF